jgi:putative ABC transport system permease protein
MLFGLAAALAGGRVLRSLLFGVDATDPLSLAAVILFLAGVSLAAIYLPARRAARSDPMVALRND